MADNISLPAATGNAATDERTINAATVHVQRVGEVGSTAIATAQVVVTSTAATLVAARDTRKRVTFYNDTPNDCWIGPATVTTTNGLRFPAGASLVLYTTALVQAIIASGTTMSGHVDVIEEFDS